MFSAKFREEQIEIIEESMKRCSDKLAEAENESIELMRKEVEQLRGFEKRLIVAIESDMKLISPKRDENKKFLSEVREQIRKHEKIINSYDDKENLKSTSRASAKCC